MQNRIIKYCFFDLYHTLIELKPWDRQGRQEHSVLGISAEEWEQAAAALYGERAMSNQIAPEEIIQKICLQLLPDASNEVIQQLLELRIDRYRSATLEVPSAVLSAVKMLRDRGIRLCLVSNADCIDKMFWHESPLAEYFEDVVFSCDVGILKPEEGIYREALARMGADPGECLYIGDGGHHELLGARKLGFTTVLTTAIIRNLWPERIQDLTSGADFVIDELTELEQVLKSIALMEK